MARRGFGASKVLLGIGVLLIVAHFLLAGEFVAVPQTNPATLGVPCPGMTVSSSSTVAQASFAVYPESPCPGNEIAYREDTNNARNLVIMNADGSGKSTVYSTGNPAFCCFSWSPDGRSIAFHVGGSIMRIDIALSGGKFQGSNLIELSSNSQAGFPAWSPLGTEIAVVADSSGRSSIAVIPPTGGPLVVLYTPPEGSSVGFPTWRFDGTQIAFRETNGTGVKAIKILDRATLTITATHVLNVTDIMWLDWARTTDVLAFSDATDAFPGKGQDIFTFDLTTGTLTLVVTEARVPSWSPGDTKLVYAKDFSYKRSIVVLDLSTGATKTLAKTGDFPNWSRA